MCSGEKRENSYLLAICHPRRSKPFITKETGQSKKKKPTTGARNPHMTERKRRLGKNPQDDCPASKREKDPWAVRPSHTGPHQRSSIITAT